MISCRELIEFLMDYDSNELPPAQREEFERHLHACPPCVAFLNTYRKTVELERDAFGDCFCEKLGPLPEDLARAILAARNKR